MISILLLTLPVLVLSLYVLRPALREWLFPSDQAPLRIDPAFSRNDFHFPDRFLLMATPWWTKISEEQRSACLVFPERYCEQKTVLAGQLETGKGCCFESEIWVKHTAIFGERNRMRAVLSDGSMKIGPFSSVERWVHADKHLSVATGCDLGVRATAVESITLEPGCRGKLISSSKILWNGVFTHPLPVDPFPNARSWGTGSDVIRHEGTAFLEGDVVLDADTHLPFPLIVRGNLYIREGAMIAGDVKAHGDLVVVHAAILGNLTAGGRLYVGKESNVQGCLRGDRLVWLGDRIVLGRPDRLVSVVGDRIELEGHGCVHGRLKALAGDIEVLM